MDGGVDTIQSELCKKDLDILAKAKVAEEATVRKAGGKFKMLPLFNETTAKIKEVCQRGVFSEKTWSFC